MEGTAQADPLSMASGDLQRPVTGRQGGGGEGVFEITACVVIESVLSTGMCVGGRGGNISWHDSRVHVPV